MEKETRLFAPSEQLLEIAEQFVERVRNRESPTVEEYEEQYPELATEIRRYLPMLLPSSSAQSVSDGLSGRDLPVAAEHLPAGINRYQLQSLLGSGSMGAVYLARDLELDRIVAFKIPRIKHNQTVERFYREARAMATVDHPHICPIYDVGEIAAEDVDAPELQTAVGKPYLTMAYIDGDDLSELMTGSWDPKVAVTMVRKIASALKVAHEAGVVHRDIKPGNIIVDRDFEPYITDFGLARRNLPEEVELTVDGQILGSPAYMSPEQINARPNLTAQADIYSLGVVLYEMVCGQRPFSGSPLTLLRDICWKEPPSPKEFRAELDVGIEAICLKALTKDTDQRYATADGLIEDLDAWLDGQTIDPPRRARSRSRPLTLLVPALCLALIAIATRPYWANTGGSPTPVVKELETVPTPVIEISQEEFETRLADHFEMHFRPRTHNGRKPDLSAEYATTFAAYGIDPETTSAKSLQLFLATQAPEAQTDILVGLESWLSCVLRETEDVPAPWLRSLLEAVHDEHTPLRKAMLEMNADRVGVLAKEYQTKHSDPRLAVIWGSWLQRIDKEIQKELLLRACDDHPDDVWINLATGRRKRGNGNAAGAIAHFEKAVELRPTAATHYQLAMTYLASREYELAADAARKAIELDNGEFAAPFLQLGKAQFFMGEYEAALESLKRADELDCDSPTQNKAFQARTLLMLGEKGMAMEKAGQAIAAFRAAEVPRSAGRFTRDMLNLLEEQDEHGSTHHRYKLVQELFATAKETGNFNNVRQYVERLLADLVAMEDGETPRISRLRKILSMTRNRRGRK